MNKNIQSKNICKINSIYLELEIQTKNRVQMIPVSIAYLTACALVLTCIFP